MGHFLPFYPLTAQKSKFLQNEIHKCTKNHNHMLCSSWDMACDRCNCYFPFWTIFCHFTLLTAQKIKIIKKEKKSLEISSFYISAPKIMVRWCTVPEIWWIWCMMDGRKWHVEVGAPHLKMMILLFKCYHFSYL